VQQETAANISANLGEELARVEAKALEIASGKAVLADAGYPAFLFRQGVIVGWSTNLFSPDVSWLNEPGGFNLVRSLRGVFVTRTWPAANNQTLLVVVPLVESFRITNKYLETTWNAAVFPEGKAFSIVDTDGYDITLGGRTVFHIVPGDDPERSTLSFVLIFCGIAFAIIGSFLLWKRLVAADRPLLALLMVVVAGATIRILMIASAFPAGWSTSSLFDSSVFASSSFNPSIGDLVLNSVFVCLFCLSLLYAFPRQYFVRYFWNANVTARYAGAVVLMLIAFFGFLFPFLYFETIFHNSSITPDWTQSLFFDNARVAAFISILLGTVASFLFCHVCLSLATTLTGRNKTALFAGITIGSLALFAIYCAASNHNYTITAVVALIYFIIVYLTKWYRGLLRTTYSTFLYLTVAVLCFSLQASLSNMRFSEERKGALQYRFGQNFLVERDVLGEYLLNEARIRISSDPFIQTSIYNPFLSKGTVRQKVRQVYMNSYFDRYDVQVHLYSPMGEPLDNLSRVDFKTFIDQFKDEVGKTDYKGVYFVNQVGDATARRYVTIIPVVRQGRTAGYVALALSLKKIVPQSVYPELLVDNRFAENFRSDQYSYAIFQDGAIISTFGDFNYETSFNQQWMNDISDGAIGLTIGGYRHIVAEGDSGRSAVITSRAYPLFYLASNISFWALLGIMLIAAGLLVRTVLYFRTLQRLNYATRIQLYIFLAFIIPLVAVSITTLYWTSRSAEEQLNAEFADKAGKLSDKIAPELDKFLTLQSDFSQLEDFMIEAVRLSGIDGSIYSPSGKLIVTNQVQIFDNLILSDLINPVALGHIRNKQTSFIVEEKIGKLSYNNSYNVLRSPSSGEILGVLSIPFFDSGKSLEKSRIDILSNIQIVFIIIFILFTVLSFVLTRWFTFPLRMITRSLSRTSLKEDNKLLDWHSNDEIGWMVQEYNRMVMNLDRSKVELARSQRESAWREMAQQVAHEIKNPLTPMKLTLQQLDMQLREGNATKDKTEASIKNLLIQLEILNEIASSFSSFARMPSPVLERIELIGIIEKAVALQADAGTVAFTSGVRKVIVMGDAQLLTRIFSNLIINGLQSGRNLVPVRLEVIADIRDGHALISFKDNGRGIDENVRDKVFLPHFTTKKSGSGLGLAIARQGIELSGGRIWFESDGKTGTTFFVSLPLAP
jgi:signal transduction histidine kinase